MSIDWTRKSDILRPLAHRETLINCLCGMKRKAYGAQKPRHINRIVDVVIDTPNGYESYPFGVSHRATLKFGDSPAQAINQGFHSKESRFRVTTTSANRAPLFNRFLWKDYSNRIMDVGSANAPHIVMRCTGEMLTDALLKSIELLLERHDVLNSSIETTGGRLHLVNRAKKPVALREVILTGTAAGDRENDAYSIANDMVWEKYDLDNGSLYRRDADRRVVEKH